MWLVAVSGGPDSMALLEWCVQQKMDVAVAHVNYSRRASSLRDQEIVNAYCRKHGIVCHVLMLGNEPIEGNFQEVARDMRYAYFASLVRGFGYEGVLVAHHQLDALETFLMKQKRGIEGVYPGIQQDTVLGEMRVMRPLLSWTKRDIMSYLDANNVPYGIDETNASDDYVRNRVRKKLLSLDRTDFQKIETEYKTAVDQYHRNQRDLENALAHVGNVMRIETYCDMDPELRLSFLRGWMLREGFDVFHVSRAYFVELDRQLHGDRVFLEHDDLLLSLSHGELFCGNVSPLDVTLDVLEYGDFGAFSLRSSGSVVQGLDVQEVDFPLHFRNPRPGDVIELSFGSKALNRWFIDQKIPRHCRKLWVIVENASNQVIFVAKLGSDKHHCSNNPLLYVIE